MRRDWRSLLAPRWLVSHVIVALVLVSFPQLGFWQLRRYDEVRQDERRIEERLDAAPVPLDEALGRDDADGFVFVRVTATGTWVAAETVAHRNRALAGQSGFDLLTPLDLGDGTAVLVRRGFVPPVRQGAADPLDPGPPAEGVVEVVGWLEESQPQPSFGATDPDEGVLDTVFNADIDRLDRQTALPLQPAILHLQEATPTSSGEFPVPQPAPDLSDNSNLSYALQWFSFTLIVGVGYAIVLRRRLRGLDRPTD